MEIWLTAFLLQINNWCIFKTRYNSAAFIRIFAAKRLTVNPLDIWLTERFCCKLTARRNFKIPFLSQAFIENCCIQRNFHRKKNHKSAGLQNIFAANSCKMYLKNPFFFTIKRCCNHANFRSKKSKL